MKIFVFLKGEGYEVINFGIDSEESVDYPDYVLPVVNALANEEVEIGILICGSAQGVSMTANKNKKIRAAICWETEIASLLRKHNNANVLCLPARFVFEEMAMDIIQIFLETKFEGGRHLGRIEKITLCSG